MHLHRPECGNEGARQTPEPKGKEESEKEGWDGESECWDRKRERERERWIERAGGREKEREIKREGNLGISCICFAALLTWAPGCNRSPRSRFTPLPGRVNLSLRCTTWQNRTLAFFFYLTSLPLPLSAVPLFSFLFSQRSVVVVVGTYLPCNFLVFAAIWELLPTHVDFHIWTWKT